MTLLCLVLLLIEAFVIYFQNGRRIASPSFIACGVSILSVFIYLINQKEYYGQDIGIETVVVFIVMLLFLFVGEIAANTIVLKIRQRIQSSKVDSVQYIHISKLKVFILFVLGVTGGLVYFVDVYRFSILLGNTPNNFFGMAEYVRHATNYGTGSVVYSSSMIVSQLSLLSECIAYFSIYAFTRNLVFFKKKDYGILLPSIGFMFYILACDNRSNMIKFVTIICIIVFGLMNASDEGFKKVNGKILKIAVPAMLLVFVAFRLLGYRTGTSQNYDFSTNIAKYTSSGIYGLNFFLDNWKGDRSTLFGENVFRLIYLKLNDFGMSFEVGASNDLFYHYLGGESNIYTGFKPLILDFGYVGASAFMALWGFCSQSSLKKIYHKNCSFIRCVVAGLLVYPLVMISIGGEWRNVLSISSLYSIFYAFIIERFISYTITARRKRVTA